MNAALEQVVYLVDDDTAVCDALQLLLTASGLRVQAFSSAESFLEKYRPHDPGCLLLDIRMPGMGGLQLRDELVARKIALPIIFITAHGDIPTAVDSLKKGAVQFLVKPFDDHQLLKEVFEALAVDARMREQAAQDAIVEERLRSLTARERQVLELVLAGKTSPAIARELFITVKTVEFHRSGIMQKLGVSSLQQLFKTYLRKVET